MFLDCLFPCCFGNNNFSKTTIQPKTRPRNTVPSSSNHGHIADKWRLLMGETHWETLLDPLDIDLRRAIVHYGEMAQTTYDTFIDDEYSRYTGGSRYSKTNFFAKLGLDYGHPYRYRVTKFIYATSEIDVPSAFILKSSALEPRLKDSNLIGYIAVAEDESVKLLGRRDIVVAWRGTIQLLEWVNDFKVSQVSATSMLGNEGDEDDPMVHQGWLSIYTSSAPSSPFENSSARDQVLTELKKLVEQYKDEEISITVTGHSLGAALATLNAVDIVANKINQPENSQKDVKPCLVTAIVFASPSVGDENFKGKTSQYDELRVLRVTNASDIVPSKPSLGYCDVGEELKIDTTKSPYLKDSGSPSSYHNLEVYLHGVAGTHAGDTTNDGSTTTFKLLVERDVALVNKGLDILKDEYLIPKSWWVLQNKGMAQESDGFWLLKDHESDDQDL